MTGTQTEMSADESREWSMIGQWFVVRYSAMGVRRGGVGMPPSDDPWELIDDANNVYHVGERFIAERYVNDDQLGADPTKFVRERMERVWTEDERWELFG